ncbi:MAG: peptidase T [Tannerella sp.]|jgi:tripeptide aminopeptidase|nr:peptidase T [Tannerella sp.]
MNIAERFIRYTTYDTQSDETAVMTPSSVGQRAFGLTLCHELESIGLEEVQQDKNGYVTATLLPNGEGKEELPTIGFIAHMDTSPDLSGKSVNAHIVHYLGGEIPLSGQGGIRLSPDMFPELDNYRGQDIIVTDGTTLLGADDKAGIAAIVSAMEYLVQHPDSKHGRVRVAFTPDEEIGRGADHFDVPGFGCDWAYTVDGGALGELEYENFNAASAQVRFKGRNVHPGTAKDVMVNASLLAMEYVSWLPPTMRPETTEGYEGFYHLTAMGGSVEEAWLSYLLRDHDRIMFNQKKDVIRMLAERMNRKYPGSTSTTIEDQYYNMREVVEPQKHIIRLASEAMRAAGIEPQIKPIRGGTDGARLSYMGLPCPNLFTGGHNFHGRYEYLPIPSLEKSMLTIIKIIESL